MVDGGTPTFELSKRFGDRAQHKSHPFHVGHVDATLTGNDVLSEFFHCSLKVTEKKIRKKNTGLLWNHNCTQNTLKTCL